MSAYAVHPVTRGPNKGRWAWRLEMQPAFTMPKGAVTPRQYRRHGIASTEARAITTAGRQAVLHMNAANDNQEKSPD